MIEKHCTKILLLIFFLTACAYSSSFGNEFLNYDDLLNVSQNIYIRQINIETLKVYFTKPLIVMYTPLVYLSYAVDHSIGGLNPFIYHLTNLLLHLINIALVFYLVRSLTKKDIAGLCASVLFAVHPMNVAAVTPVSVRSSLLYTVFFLAAYISYIKYLERDHKPLFLATSLFLFILSALSKSNAVVLPAVFLLTDHYLGRELNKKALFEKIPFIAISIIFGILTVLIRKDAIAAQVFGRLEYTIIDRLILINHTVISFLLKLFAPFDLLAFYNYPVKVGGWLPLKYYLSLMLSLVFICGVFVLKKYMKILIFPSLFFLINIILVIKIVPVGFEMTADRYVYIAYIGFFMTGGIWLDSLLKIRETSEQRKLIAGCFMVVIAIFSVLSYQRSKDWHDSIRFWNTIVAQYEYNPELASFIRGTAKTDIKELPGASSDLAKAYTRRGASKIDIHDYQGAVDDFTNAIQLNPYQAIIYNNRCLAEFYQENYDTALKDCLKAIELDPDHGPAHINLGKILQKKALYQEAMDNFTKAIEISQDSAEAYSGRGGVKLDIRDHQGAIADFSRVITLVPGHPAAYNDRCFAKLILGDLDSAMEDCSKAIELAPQFAVAYINRADIQYNKGMYAAALSDANKAINLAPGNDAGYIIRGNIYYKMGKSGDAIEDYSMAIKLAPSNAIAYFNRGSIKFSMNDISGACADWKESGALGFEGARKKSKAHCR